MCPEISWIETAQTSFEWQAQFHAKQRKPTQISLSPSLCRPSALRFC
jgi:hypothetical protein